MVQTFYVHLSLLMFPENTMKFVALFLLLYKRGNKFKPNVAPPLNGGTVVSGHLRLTSEPTLFQWSLVLAGSFKIPTLRPHFRQNENLIPEGHTIQALIFEGLPGNANLCDGLIPLHYTGVLITIKSSRQGLVTIQKSKYIRDVLQNFIRYLTVIFHNNFSTQMHWNLTRKT